MNKKSLQAYMNRRPELKDYQKYDLVDFRELTFEEPSSRDREIIRFSQKSEMQSVQFGIMATMVFLAYLIFNMLNSRQYGIHPTAFFTLTVLFILLAVLILHFLHLQKGPKGIIRAKLVYKTPHYFIKKPGLDPLRDGGQKAVLLLEGKNILLFPASFNRSDHAKLYENKTVILAKLYTNSYKVFPQSDV